MQSENTIRQLVRQVNAYARDDQLSGRLYVDLVDMLEACRWFVSSMDQLGEELTRDELESLLIKIDVNVVQHLGFHMRSLKRDMPRVLDAVGRPDDKAAE